jgi:hypothetical protein
MQKEVRAIDMRKEYGYEVCLMKEGVKIEN